MRSNVEGGPDHKTVKLTYTRFPRDWTPKQIYEFLIAWAEKSEKAGDDESGETTKGSETQHPSS